jgi:hypothetical protein
MKLSFAFCKEEMKQDKLTIGDRGTFLHLELLIFLYFGDRKKIGFFFSKLLRFHFVTSEYFVDDILFYVLTFN